MATRKSSKESVDRKVTWNDAFDAIAKSKTTKTSSAVRIAEVTDEIKKKVDKFVKVKAEIVLLQATLTTLSDELIEHTRAQQDKDGYAKDYNKSYALTGNTDKITYTTSDKFTIDQTVPTQEALKKLVGNDYDLIVKKVRTITLKEGIDANKEFMTKLMEALTVAGLSLEETFEVIDSIVVQKGMDETQYNLIPQNKLAEFRTLVKQYKATLK